MKHSYLILIALFFFSFTQAQIVNIPDANFKNALVNSNCVDTDDDGFGDIDVDTNNDGEIQVSEAEAILNLDVSFEDISSIQGIEAFINLQVLECHYNELIDLNVSELQNLNILKCSRNQLITLNVNGLPNLLELDCNTNQLTALDLIGLTNLVSLNCGENQLTSLDVRGLESLDLLYCYNNELTILEISGLNNLSQLRCHNNFLSSIDLNGLTSLNVFVANSNQFITLNFSGLPNLDVLNCGDNLLTELNVTDLSNLTGLYCYNNFLTSLDVSGMHDLFYFNCNENLLTSLFIKNGSVFSSGYSFDFNPNLTYICADDFETENVLSKIDDYGYTGVAVNSYCSFVPGGEYYTINGQSKIDINLNGCDVSDINFPSLKLNVTNGTEMGIFISRDTGSYSIPVQEGIHIITPIFENPDYFIVSPTSITVNFPTETSPSIQDFCITSSGTTHNDLEIVIIPLEVARPGFDTDYKILYKNKGNTTMSGTFEFNYNENANLMEFVSSSPNAESNVANVLTWSYANLLPFGTREVLITMGLNTPTDVPPLNGGDALGFIANIFPVPGDETPTDNNFQLKQIVANSLDPNDKTCLQGATITPEQVGKYVHYMIRFENTGTASAVNIVVKDEIDMSKYDVSTLIPLHASHDFITRIKDDNIVEFIFEDIYLPFDDANNDGYVVFKIKTLVTLELGDTFSNDAEIYFDYNAAIITNDELTTVAENLSVEESELQTIVKIYPNPVNDYLFIESKNTIKSITIYDINGRLLQKLALTGNDTNTKMDISSLSKGLYFVSVKTDVGEQTTKIIKE